MVSQSESFLFAGYCRLFTFAVSTFNIIIIILSAELTFEQTSVPELFSLEHTTHIYIMICLLLWCSRESSVCLIC